MKPIAFAGQTDVGRHRQENQDTFIGAPLWTDTSVLLAAIDGVGGYAGGAQAAALAREAIEQYMNAPTGDPLTMLREAVIYANNQILRQKEADPTLARMCCVLTVAVADQVAGKLFYVHVGDTRLYRLRRGELQKITHDHSLVGVREDANQLTEREAMLHPRRNEILRDVGSVPHRVDDPDFLESGETDLVPGDSLLLCSDGLTDMLTREQITTIITQPTPLEDQLLALIQEANEAGGHDNITVVVAKVPSNANVPGHNGTRVVPTDHRVTPKAASLPSKQPVPATGTGWVGKLLALLAGVGLGLLLWWQLTPEPPRLPVATPVDTVAASPVSTSLTNFTQTP